MQVIRSLFITLATLSALAQQPAAQPEKALSFDGGVVEKHQMIPMRDGAHLSTYLYFPPGNGPWPVLYEQRYSNLRGDSSRVRYAKYAAAGYVVAAQNFRGTHKSEGVYQGYRALGWGKLRDGYDTVEWLAKQPWSTGKIGTWGGSQAGYAQNFLAVTQPPHLVAQFITDGGLSLFHLGYRIGGATRVERFKAGMAVDARENSQGLQHLKDQLSHPNYDAWWQQEDATLHFPKMNVPAFILASWFDFMARGSIDSYIGRHNSGGPNARANQWLIIGPWLHGGSKNSTKIAEVDLPASSGFDVDAYMIRWFDYWLKGKPTGVDREPKVRYYVMGLNQWREANDWPVPSTPNSYFLAADGSLSTKDAPAGKSEFLSDPDHPAPSPGRSEPTARDGRAFESHKDVRVFTSAPLTQPVEWTGDVKAELYVSSSAPDTDVIVRVSDVYPDGRSMLLVQSIRRAKYRDSYEKPTLLQPGKIYKIPINVGWLSQQFQPGHRIRVTVSSTMFDYYEPNAGTGESPTIDGPARKVLARNTLHHGGVHASRIIAPVPPASIAQARDTAR
ncbi:MAG: CocE/NonD family hydrolase [Bryobacterales bacterium]|nr:CocE/NonD family hydrolase [Bryobacterales bacterium]